MHKYYLCHGDCIILDPINIKETIYFKVYYYYWISINFTILSLKKKKNNIWNIKQAEEKLPNSKDEIDTNEK